MPDPTALPLAIAQTVQLQSVRYGQIRLYSKLVGYVDKHSIVITAPLLIGGLQSIIEGDQFICRAFSGKYAFAFRTHVLRLAQAPFPHLFLAYPKLVEKAVVRKATRVSVELKGAFKKASEQGEAIAEAAYNDLSLSGAAAICATGTAEVGEKLTVVIASDGSEDATEFQCQALVKNLRAADHGEGQCQYGLEFLDLTAEQSRVLMGIVQRHLMLEV
jgi:c-di-GMP-binding flagellar brake protein YcgR